MYIYIYIYIYDEYNILYLTTLSENPTEITKTPMYLNKQGDNSKACKSLSPVNNFQLQPIKKP